MAKIGVPYNQHRCIHTLLLLPRNNVLQTADLKLKPKSNCNIGRRLFASVATWQLPPFIPGYPATAAQCSTKINGVNDVHWLDLHRTHAPPASALLFFPCQLWLGEPLSLSHILNAWKFYLFYLSIYVVTAASTQLGIHLTMLWQKFEWR